MKQYGTQSDHDKTLCYDFSDSNLNLMHNSITL